MVRRTRAGALNDQSAAVDDLRVLPLLLWTDDENDRQRIDVEVELVAPDRLTVTPTNGGRTVTYEPTETNPGCD